ncbi:hypothetical protein B0O80DRAFT_441262 [Mortierella sp. GBAus27b]|nr:hypothetical protein B0O80DRAFT_441262 [Mortierella sp. GBAus27b]
MEGWWDTASQLLATWSGTSHSAAVVRMPDDSVLTVDSGVNMEVCRLYTLWINSVLFFSPHPFFCGRRFFALFPMTTLVSLVTKHEVNA